MTEPTVVRSEPASGWSPCATWRAHWATCAGWSPGYMCRGQMRRSIAPGRRWAPPRARCASWPASPPTSRRRPADYADLC